MSGSPQVATRRVNSSERNQKSRMLCLLCMGLSILCRKPPEQLGSLFRPPKGTDPFSSPTKLIPADRRRAGGVPDTQVTTHKSYICIHLFNCEIGLQKLWALNPAPRFGLEECRRHRTPIPAGHMHGLLLCPCCCCTSQASAHTVSPAILPALLHGGNEIRP